MKTRYMEKRHCIAAFAAALMAAAGAGANTPRELVDFADPFTGTDNLYELSSGNLYPYIAVPWGMNAWSPQTGKAGKRWFYDWKAKKICGFHHTHQPSPWIGDYAQFTVMPMTGKARFGEEERASWYSHRAERATPAYYKVYLADYGITAELAPSSRAAVMRITWPTADSPRFLVDALKGDCSVKVDAARRRVTGHSTLMHVRENEKGFKIAPPKTFFVVEFDRDIVSSEIKGGCALVTFAPAKRGEKTNVRIASSFISPEQALVNLRELDGGFDAVHEKGRKAWNDVLGRFRVEGGGETDMRKFYTCLYRALIFPRATHEIDAQGRIVHRSFYGKGVLPGHYYCDTGFWDTFRALFPLLNLAYPDKSREMYEGLLHCFEESGWLPEWSAPHHRNCMIGQNSASVVADAYFAGCMDDTTARRLYEALLKSANGVHPRCQSVGRLGWEDYNRIGYVPCDGFPHSASRTLEYAYADWCIWKLGVALGRPEEETSLHLKRSGNWRNVFCAKVKSMRGRKRDGSWAAGSDPDVWGGDFAESSPRQYNWSVMHDIDGLVKAFGGREAFVAALDEVFATHSAVGAPSKRGTTHEEREMCVADFGQYAHGNQPIQHMIYLYTLAGRRDRAAYWARRAMDELYAARPDGYCGDEDNGQTSAWFVWSAMGMYPVCPPSGEYVLGGALFDKVTISRPDGVKIEIGRDSTFNGRKITAPSVRRDDLVRRP